MLNSNIKTIQQCEKKRVAWSLGSLCRLKPPDMGNE